MEIYSGSEYIDSLVEAVSFW